ncbi:hypothetical protein [Candidatus Absconditicoccus praedator]|uniref:hypothetical protein n=1 Tax=Candidatus Absconditicoccus praedator TaxID=2735562 RepID=UPI001E4990C8|nr:hypothetical protein [Candidatus Absconditicoccus praedator]UFX82953.1 hypothetical protein HLG78_02355 [Candidatus Absconditicoccus praedator]
MENRTRQEEEMEQALGQKGHYSQPRNGLDTSQTYPADCESYKDVITSVPGIRTRQLLVNFLGEKEITMDNSMIKVREANRYEKINDIFDQIFENNKTVISSEELQLVQEFLSLESIEEVINMIYAQLELRGKEKSIKRVGNILKGTKNSLGLVEYLKKYFNTGKEIDGNVILPNFESYEFFDNIGSFDTNGNALAVRDEYVGTVEFDESGLIQENTMFVKVNEYGLAKINYAGKGWGVVRVNSDNSIEVLVDFVYNSKEIGKIELEGGKVIKKGTLKNKILLDTSEES